MARPTPSEIYRAQQELTRRITRVLAEILSPYLGLRVTAEIVRAISRAILPVVLGGRDKSKQLARAVYVETKREWSPGSSVVPEPRVREYTEQHLAEAVDRALLVGGNDVIHPEDLERVAAVADTHVRNAYRNTSLAYVHNDDDIVGWARIDPLPPTCEFCRLLIARGPVYKSAKTAGGRNKFHTGCTCIPQLVVRGQERNWPGREMYLAERQRYENATKGKSGKEARKAWREAVDKANGRETARKRETSEQSSKKLNMEEALRASRRQLQVLESMNPTSDSAKRYRSRQVKVLRERISRLEAQIKRASGGRAADQESNK